MATSVFLDAAYAIALTSPSDNFHKKAQDFSFQLEKSRTLAVTTRAVMLEIGNALSKRRFRHVAMQILQTLEDDPQVEIVPLTEELYAQAFALYRARSDKDWGLVDCVSFVVMRERGIDEALTSDEHFNQAGFRALLRDS